MASALSPILTILKNKWVQLALCACLCIGIGFMAGRSSAPEPDVEIEEKVVEKTVVDLEAIDIAVAKAKQEWSRLQKEKTVTRVITKPSGEKIEETVTEVETLESQESQKEEKTESTVTQKEVIEIEKETKIEVESYKPQWSVGGTLYKTTQSIMDFEMNEGLDYDLRVGRKVIWDLWLEGTYKIKSEEVGIGIRYEF